MKIFPGMHTLMKYTVHTYDTAITKFKSFSFSTAVQYFRSSWRIKLHRGRQSDVISNHAISH
jgi:hypothetical protein